MRLTWKDGLATIFVGGAVAAYGFWMVGVEVLRLASTRAVSTVVLILGIAGCFAARTFFEAIYGADRGDRPSTPYVVLVTAIGIVALAAAVVALIGGSTVALTTLIIAMVALWAMATIRHLSMNRSRDLAAVR
jgi:hypothetical protein